jgi:hypothetical protein
VRDAILRIGEVSGIEGRKVFVKVDKNKNSSDLLLDGEIIKNVSVGSYVEIRKGFLSIIGKADGEKLTEESYFKKGENNQLQQVDKNSRFLTLSLVGYIGFDGRFVGGVKELPLMGNEAFVLTDRKIHSIHNLRKDQDSLHITIAKTDNEEIDVSLPIDGIFNSHIAVFGNTGSGKSNTVASLFQGLFNTCSGFAGFSSNCQFVIIDFNGEYIKDECITPNKRTYNLRTRDNFGDKLPTTFDELFDVETLSVLVEATDKTQKPFLKRTLRFFKRSKGATSFSSYLRIIVQNQIRDVLRMTNKEVGFKLLDYLEEVLDPFLTYDNRRSLDDGLDFNNTFKEFIYQGTYLNTNPGTIENTNYFRATACIDDSSLSAVSDLSQFLIFLHLQLIEDAYRYKVQIEHIYGVINRFKAKQSSIERTFVVEKDANIWGVQNCVIVNLRDVNLDMRKTIPLLLAKNLYNSHKRNNNKKSLNIIIDEAHNILSKTSFRETEDWKDYRLETFEEIIKEGRKFGVFLTISSQRPNDISDTIISQAHNYFIHQLINQKDLLTIGTAVSYIDKVTEESIPTLSVGTCVFSGVATPMPLKLRITELPEHQKPASHTLKFEDLLSNEPEFALELDATDFGNPLDQPQESELEELEDAQMPEAGEGNDSDDFPF